MEKKYQVFVSSTYEDLLLERQEVMQALLELDCIPVGMELFPATDDDQWTLIKNLIDDCDYYVLIVGGRYGSTNKDGISFTQMEYEYAHKKEIPIISFLPKDPNKIELGKSEQDPQLKIHLEKFKDLVQFKMCRFWSDPIDLGSQVSRSLIKLIRNKPRPGWVKADQLPSQNMTEDFLVLKNRVVELEKIIENFEKKKPKGTESLIQGNDSMVINFTYREGIGWKKEEKFDSIKLTMNEIFYVISPLMVDEDEEYNIKKALNSEIYSRIKNSILIEIDDYNKPEISDSDYQTIKVQLRALGLIEKSIKKRSLKDTSTY